MKEIEERKRKRVLKKKASGRLIFWKYRLIYRPRPILTDLLKILADIVWYFGPGHNGTDIFKISYWFELIPVHFSRYFEPWALGTIVKSASFCLAVEPMASSYSLMQKAVIDDVGKKHRDMGVFSKSRENLCMYLLWF